MKIEEVKRKIDEFFSSDKRPASDTKSDLEDLKDHIEILIDALKGK